MSYSNLDQFLQISGRICEKAALSVMLQLAQASPIFRKGIYAIEISNLAIY